MEQQLVQANTVQNESMTPSPGSPESPGPPGHLLQETPRSGGVRHKSPSAGGSAEEDMGGSPRQPAPRQPREPHTSGSLERRLEELEKVRFSREVNTDLFIPFWSPGYQGVL